MTIGGATEDGGGEERRRSARLGGEGYFDFKLVDGTCCFEDEFDVLSMIRSKLSDLSDNSMRSTCAI